MQGVRFVTALGIRPGDLAQIALAWGNVKDRNTPLANVLISPLFADPASIQMIRRLKEQGAVNTVYFDSGGYQVQKGRIDYNTLYNRLLQYYEANDWADYYVMPDFPPVSGDSDSIVQEKVRITVDGTKRFFYDLPSTLRSRALAVVQGRRVEQVKFCLVNYHDDLGISYVGFGSFPTNGAQSSINHLDAGAAEMLACIRRQYPSVRIHAFGVGNPPVAYILNHMGIHSFDSSGWIKAAAYGNIYFPFTRAYNITYRRIEPGRGALDAESFERIKTLTGHSCPYCSDFYELSRNRTSRFLHNLICMMETVEDISAPLASEVISHWAPAYKRFLTGRAL
ncbi:MAG TPA: hypothetical protein GXX23_09305 [Firmicutes bacterium]|nr:hypothetical protein [Candidatus Fermentithermobacillaceae bacterium]